MSFLKKRRISLFSIIYPIILEFCVEVLTIILAVYWFNWKLGFVVFLIFFSKNISIRYH